MEGRIEELLVRIASATERFAAAEEAIVELATSDQVVPEDVTILGEPCCPHCQTYDPECRSEGGNGRMSEFVFVALCGNCKRPIYALPQGWLVFQTPEEVRQAMEGRVEE